MLTAEEYRESLRRYRPRVFVEGEAVESVADEPRLAPGIAAIGVTYDFATRPEHAEHADIMTAKQPPRGRPSTAWPTSTRRPRTCSRNWRPSASSAGSRAAPSAT